MADSNQSLLSSTTVPEKYPDQSARGVNMFPLQIDKADPEEFSRCAEEQTIEYGNKRSPVQKSDAALKESISHALWKDDVLRAIEYEQIEVYVKNGTVYLSGHIVNTNSRNRIENAIRAVPGIQGFRNDLVLDDQLTNQVASSLGALEHIYDCKFFTGASHGLVSLNGIVPNESVKMMAEKCAADHPNVRGVINHIHVSGKQAGVPHQPFLQPLIGETIYFLDGPSGVVKQVIMNPNNRRVIAMTVQVRFADPLNDVQSLNNGGNQSPDRQMVIPMDQIRFLSRDSGFLQMNSSERGRDLDFEPGSFISPKMNWRPPYPYCMEDVLFSTGDQAMNESYQLPLTEMAEDTSFKQQVFANDSLGG
jgi:osmotically-inducible protein OsmY